MTAIRSERLVAERAGNRCEYCRMHQSLQGASFHVEHIIPRSKGGKSNLSNLAWACPGCNLKKSDRIDGPDPQTSQLIRLFHPRTDLWPLHFEWQRTTLIGLTTVGRATILALDLNHPRRLAIRNAESAFGLFPPGEH